ncbi:MAG: PadR family transcriptional regulator [Phycisphaerales bacterium]|nr:MAG: PadR family transcriptional regulator [Phycisphaerales bacterium]
MSERIISSPLELAIMGLLWQQPRCGYELLKVFSETAMGGFGNSPGAIYPALRRLERNGSITGEVENRDTLRPRQVYSLTTAGAETLKQHLRQPVTRDDVMRYADGVLLRFAFAGELLGRREAIRILDEFVREIDAYLPDLKAQLADLPQTAGPYGRYALQHGIDMYHADARWARKTITQLKKRRAARRTGLASGAPRRRGSL